SHGTGIALWRSVDGGLTWGREGGAGGKDTSATAWDISGQIGLADLGLDGTVSAHIGHREAGFASGAVQARDNQWRWGLAADIAVSDTTSLVAAYDGFSEQGGERKESAELGVALALDPFWN